MKKNQENDIYKRFNLDLKKILDRPLTKYNKDRNLREMILLFELEDFDYLVSSMEEQIQTLEKIGKDMLERFKIEKRNNFSNELEDKYSEFVCSNEDLRGGLIEKQALFYQKRIEKIRNELKALDKE